MRNRRPALLLLFLALVPVSGCTHHARYEDVDQAASQFFERLRAAKYDEIYDNAAESLKADNPRPKVVEDLEKFVSYGVPQHWRRLNTTFTTEGKYRIALPLYTVWTDNVQGKVSLKFADESGQWKLAAFGLAPRGILKPSPTPAGSSAPLGPPPPTGD